ncbi:MAG: YgiQ family radical SAM protein, partial [Gammaproteobacteria bacterium]|nr:YgiQ family radical SAM protein [Gammaproteobacteria bacterium]
MTQPAPDLFAYRRHWAHKFGPAPFLPMSREEMDLLGWDSCDIIIVTGDAYVDHPSFGMAVIGRVLEAQGFRVGIIAQPDWRSADDIARLGRPNLYFGVTGGNMDSMVNRYTSERRLRSDDAYTPGGEGGRRPDRAVIVYSQRCREAYRDVPIVLGGIEASLRRIAHFDYWQEKVRRSVLIDAKADMLLFGNAERAIVELSHRLAAGEPIEQIRDLRGTAFALKALPTDWTIIDSTTLDEPGRIEVHPDPYESGPRAEGRGPEETGPGPRPPGPGPMSITLHTRPKGQNRAYQAVRLPGFEAVRNDPVLYAHASRVLHLESNPGNARALVQSHGERDVWINPPPIPLRTPELDRVFELPYQRVPHPACGDARIPAYEMIRFSVNIMRGCFGGCSFCSITEHEGRIIQNRSEQSILREIENIRDHTPGFTGVISDLGGPTANMWRLHCKDPKIESSCRRLSCVYPGICDNLNTDQMPLVRLYRKARELP